MFDAWKSDPIRAHMVLCLAECVCDSWLPVNSSGFNGKHPVINPHSCPYIPSCNDSYVSTPTWSKASGIQQFAPIEFRMDHSKVHLAYEHSPILGDTAYGWHHMNRRYASVAQRPMWLERSWKKGTLCDWNPQGGAEGPISSTTIGCGIWVNSQGIAAGGSTFHA